MIYLIGGSPRCGKTKLAKKLSKKLNIPWISTDALRPVILPYIPKKRVQNNFPFEKMFQGDKVDEYFSKYTGKDMLKADIIEAQTMWPGIKSFIEHKIFSNQDFIIEGVHLLPKCVKQLSKTKRTFKVAYLAKINTNKILDGIKRNSDKYDWILKQAQNEATLLKAAEMISIYGKYFEKAAKENHFDFYNTENQFNHQLNNIVKTFFADRSRTSIS